MTNARKIIIVAVCDLLVFAVLLLTFAWFHHGKPQEFNSVELLNTPIPVSSDTPAPLVTETPTQKPDATELPAGVTPAPTPELTPTPTPEPTGLLGAKFAEKFTDGEVIYTDECYRSKNVAIEISEHDMKVQWCPVHYFVADIYIRDITSLRCAVSEVESHKEWVQDLANKNNGIVAVSGDYFLFHNRGLAIRNGVLLRDKLHGDQDVCVIYQDGTMETYLKGQVDVNAILARNPYHAFSFGPRLLENGQPMTVFNTSVETWNPRCAIGYYEPGHYCFVLVDGRDRDYSLGLEMGELSKLMYELGCTEAYNMDGGMTAMMSYKGELISHPCGGGRKNCDIVYIAEPLG